MELTNVHTLSPLNTLVCVTELVLRNHVRLWQAHSRKVLRAQVLPVFICYYTLETDNFLCGKGDYLKFSIVLSCLVCRPYRNA